MGKEKDLDLKDLEKMLQQAVAEKIQPEMKEYFGAMNPKVRKAFKRPKKIGKNNPFMSAFSAIMNVAGIAEDEPAVLSGSPMVERLRKLCAADAATCEAALKENGNNVDRALRSLAVSGKLSMSGLDPDEVSDKIYALVQVRVMYDKQSEMPAKTKKVFGVTEKSLNRFRNILSGKTKLSPSLLKLGTMNRETYFDLAHPERKRPKKKPKVINVKPFPKLTRGFGWEGADTLRSWKGYQSRGGGYTSQDSDEPSTGKVKISVTQPVKSEDDAPPTPAQIAAYQYLKDNEVKITAAVVQAIFEEYVKTRKRWSKHEAFNDSSMPVIADASALRNMIGLGSIHVLNVGKNGYAYIGFECGCTWDEEHGAGAMTHKDRVIAVGQADHAFMEWVAMKDGGKSIRALKAK